MSVDRRRVVSADGAPELELRFNGGFGGRAGSEVLGMALGRHWPQNWRIRSLVRDGDAAVVILRRVERPTMGIVPERLQ
jgi:hypothetical protein